jgi:endonuclease/exonuclease/phosphatase family metal-dependent hydrolase
LPAVTRIRVATFNVRNGRAFDGWSSWPFRRATTARTIAALDADVVALQEVYAFQQRYFERRLPRYEVVAAGRDDGTKGERCPVLAAPPVARVVDVSHLWFGPTPDQPGTRLPDAKFPRVATIATLAVGPDGHQVQATSTHLDEASGERRRASAEQLATWLDLSMPQVVMGDFNADPGSDVLSALEDRGLTLVEPAGTTGTAHQFTGRTDGRRIDHILVSAHFEVVDARVVTARLGRPLASDHFPVLATLDLEG